DMVPGFQFGILLGSTISVSTKNKLLIKEMQEITFNGKVITLVRLHLSIVSISIHPSIPSAHMWRLEILIRIVLRRYPPKRRQVYRRAVRRICKILVPSLLLHLDDGSFRNRRVVK